MVEASTIRLVQPDGSCTPFSHLTNLYQPRSCGPDRTFQRLSNKHWRPAQENATHSPWFSCCGPKEAPFRSPGFWFRMCEPDSLAPNPPAKFGNSPSRRFVWEPKQFNVNYFRIQNRIIRWKCLHKSSRIHHRVSPGRDWQWMQKYCSLLA